MHVHPPGAFTNVTSLAFFFPGNHGEGDETSLQYIGMQGDHSHDRREAVDADVQACVCQHSWWTSPRRRPKALWACVTTTQTEYGGGRYFVVVGAGDTTSPRPFRAPQHGLDEIDQLLRVRQGPVDLVVVARALRGTTPSQNSREARHGLGSSPSTRGDSIASTPYWKRFGKDAESAPGRS